MLAELVKECEINLHGHWKYLCTHYDNLKRVIVYIFVCVIQTICIIQTTNS